MGRCCERFRWYVLISPLLVALNDLLCSQANLAALISTLFVATATLSPLLRMVLRPSSKRSMFLFPLIFQSFFDNAVRTDAPWGIARLSQTDKLAIQNTSRVDFTYTYDDTAGAGSYCRILWNIMEYQSHFMQELMFTLSTPASYMCKT